MEILLATAGTRNSSLQRQFEEFGFKCSAARLDGVIALIVGDTEISADLIVLDPPAFTETGEDATSITVNLASAVRRLDRNVAMWDGRRWSPLPIAVNSALGNETIAREIFGQLNVTELPRAAETRRMVLTRLVDEYRQKIVEDFVNLGLHVSENNGVITVDGLTVSLRKHADSDYYSGSKDQRLGRRFVLRRDPGAIANQIDEFMDLINRPGVDESNLQEFFERNEHFLTLGMKDLVPHAYLPFEEDDLRSADVPDFILKPRIRTSITRDSDYEVLDIKRPDERVLVGRGRRMRFSAAVHDAITQLRDYRDYFRDPAHQKEVASRLDRPVKHPKLGIIIGRAPHSENIEDLDRAQASDPDVQITTYDEILDRQINLLPPS